MSLRQPRRISQSKIQNRKSKIGGSAAPRRRLRVAANLALLLLSLGRVAAAEDNPNVVTAPPLSAEEQLKKFHLPPGFEIQLVAAEPEVKKPINLNFDSRGRLFFSQSIEYPFPAKPGTTPRDTVKVIEDFDARGHATKISTFVDGLNIPIGVLPIPKGVLVYSIPNIYRCLDPEGVGHVTQREVLFGPFQTKDTHGMNNTFTRGLDGWIYANHGYSNDDTVAGRDGQAIHMQSGNTYRFHEDGSHLEYFTHGRVNPFGIAFDPLDNMYVSDCETLSIFLHLRGAYYPSFGKPHDGLGFGPPMLDHFHGPTAIAGLVYYAAEQFPPEYRNLFFCGNPVSHRICCDRPAERGSFFWATIQPDFLTCDDQWFRPVDLKLGPDGAIYMADFYNRIIGHYEVPLTHPGRDHDHGRIWRIVYTGTKDKPAPPPTMPNPLTADANCEQLIAQLADPNLIVRTMATHELVDRIGQPAVEPLKKLLLSDASNPWQRAHGLWVLQRLGALDDDLVKRLAADPDRLVRVHLVKALAERPKWEDEKLDVFGLVRGKLVDPDAFVRRVAAEALGRHPQIDNVRLLADLWGKTPPEDTHLIHVTRIALRDQLAAPGMYAALAKADLPGKDDALRARLAEVSLGVPNAESAHFLLEYMSQKQPDAGRLPDYAQHLARYLPVDQLPGFLASAAKWRVAGGDLLRQRDLLRAVQQGLQERGGVATPAELTAWAADVANQLLASPKGEQILKGIELARDFRIAAAFDRLATLVAGGEPASLRPSAIDACVAIDAAKSVPLLSELVGRASEPANLRQKAAQALGTINSDAARAELLRRLVVAPERLAVDIAAGLAASRAGGEALLTTVVEGKASARLLREPTVLDRLKHLGLPDLDARLTKLTAGLPAGDDRLQQLMQQRRAGYLKFKPDAALGHQAFQKICAACHQVNGEGHKIGPPLDGIGVRGLDRLLEDILDPSRNVAADFRTTLLTLNDGRTYSGLVIRDEGELVILADQQGKEVRIAKPDIAERRISPISPMPANVPDLLTEQEFYNLLAFLLAQQPK